ncbi:MAG: membrane protein insertion efficiency factor YidD [candidate division SR1 bacterium]|nr:membrane protein insertion efficiency factor YidD [candidate division SR1 bacterium]
MIEVYRINPLRFFRKKFGINKILAIPAIRFIRLYQYTLSPDKGLPSLRLKGRVCMHIPHCSQYSLQVMKRYGFWPGIGYAMDRVLHCTGGMHKIYDPDHYKVVFFSGAPIGVPFLQALAQDKRFEIVGVVSQGDKPVGRGMEMAENIIKIEGKKIQKSQPSTSQLSTFIQTPSKLNPEKSEEGRQFAERLKEKNPDFLVVIAYGKIIPQAILNIPTIAPINVHGSLLPKYRGASPIQSCLLNNDKETGITIMKMDAEMDTGNMIDKLGFKIGFDRTSKNIIERFQTYGPKFLNDTLRKYGKKMLGEVKQDDSKATYCSKIEKESGLIDPRKDSLHDIYCKYRAYAQRPKIYFMIEDKRVIVEELKLYENIYMKEKDIPLMYQNNSLNESVEHLSLKPEGKKAMDRKEFLHGYLR